MEIRNGMEMQMQQDERIIYLSGDIETSNVAQVCEKLLNIISFDSKMADVLRNYELKPIHLNVQSFGGSVHDMWSLIDIIESSTTPIITYCNGYCMSAAAMIFLAGHYRVMYKHSSFMLHQLWSFIGGKVKDLSLETENIENLHKQMLKYIKKHTNLPKKLLKKIDGKKEDVYLTAKECKKYGICDSIAENSGLRKIMLDTIKEQEELD